MASVWYLGGATSRTITDSEWAAAGVAGASTTTWNAANGYSIPTTSFTAAQLTILGADPRFNVEGADGPRPGSTPAIAEVMDQSPKELGYAETVNNFSNTATALNLGDPNVKVTGLNFNIVGTGRPVEIECFLPKVGKTTAGTVRLSIVQDNATILNCNDRIFTANATAGMIVKARTLPLVKGQTYAFDARLVGDTAGTTSATHAAASHKGYLSAVQR